MPENIQLIGSQDCSFSVPQNYLGQTPSSTDESFQFASSSCAAFSQVQERISNTGDTKGFFVDKTISYGNYIIIIFLFLFLVFGVVKFFVDFLIPKKLDWKQH